MRPERLYRALLLCYPSAFREEYGQQMLLAFAEQMTEARQARGRFGQAALWLQAAHDVVAIAPKEHTHMILQDVRYALRTLAAKPGFAVVAILTLALGIGANTALFSLWNAVLHASLPVHEPERLVVLTNPVASGVAVGSQTGERSLLTYAEFEHLRDRAEGFTGLMASQSSLERWQARIQGGGEEEVQGRMVSGGYFEVLGVTPLLGRAFTPADDRTDTRGAVISYTFWQRRFAGQTDVLGKPITIRKAALTIIGVTPQGFAGETSGQQPDLWVPLRVQPAILPGRDWLHDVGQEKVMWLHVFGRLQQHATLAKAQASANVVFKSALDELYGSALSPENKRQFLNQHLTLRPAAGGASQVRERLSDPLKVLLVAVGVVLLIACANLANLLLARGTARQKEIVLRLTLGAGRARLVRQLMTESLVLAAAGGLAGFGIAYVFQHALVSMITQSDRSFGIAFSLEPAVLAFSLSVTMAAAILFGVLPAWQTTKADAGASLKGLDRTVTTSAANLRWGRLLVVAQIGLSLPLLVGGGLLLRTIRNLQHADLGYEREQLLIVRIDVQSAGYEIQRREPVFRDLLEQFRRIPGVRAATYSDNGLFSGRDSGDQIEVEGYTRKGDNDRGSRWDQVGPGYFSSIGVPILLGREINDGDRQGTTKVCVINEAFAKLFFAGRNPIGRHITTIDGDRRNVHQIVGVARDIRTHGLRGAIPPRYFVPMSQPLGETDGAIYSIRSAGDPAAVLPAIRQAIQRTNDAIPVMSAMTLEERVNMRIAQDRVVAQLATAFGSVALALVAIGIYGVLSYGVARRRNEIGIRIALGARPVQVVRMILRETSTLVIAGLVIGGALAAGAVKLIASQMYGLAPHDPLTLGLALGLLTLVAFLAAYVPARRVSRLDPILALRDN